MNSYSSAGASDCTGSAGDATPNASNKTAFFLGNFLRKKSMSLILIIS